MIVIVSNEEALSFLIKNKTKDDYIFVRDSDVWYAYKKNEKIVSVIGIQIKKDYIKIDTSLTLKNYRCNGFSTVLRKKIIEDFCQYEIRTYSTRYSQGINKKLGFEIVRTLKNGTELLGYERKDIIG